MRSGRRTCVAVAMLWCATAAAGPGAGGTLTVDGTTLTPVWAAAVHTTGGYPEGPLVRVYLVPVEVDAAGLEEALDIEDALSDRAGRDYAYVTLEPGGEVVNVGVVLEGYRNFGFSAPKVDGVSIADGIVKGRVYTEGEQTLMDTVYVFDLTFEAKLVEPPPPTATLAAGGGEPGRCYLEYLRGSREGDVAALRAYCPAEKVQEIAQADEWSMEYLLSSFKEYAPQEMTVDGGADYGAWAVLEVHGKDWSGDKVEGTVKMVRDGDVWRFAGEDLETVWE